MYYGGVICLMKWICDHGPRLAGTTPQYAACLLPYEALGLELIRKVTRNGSFFEVFIELLPDRIRGHATVTWARNLRLDPIDDGSRSISCRIIWRKLS